MLNNLRNINSRRCSKHLVMKMWPAVTHFKGLTKIQVSLQITTHLQSKIGCLTFRNTVFLIQNFKMICNDRYTPSGKSLLKERLISELPQQPKLVSINFYEYYAEKDLQSKIKVVQKLL